MTEASHQTRGPDESFVPIYRFMGNELGLSGVELLVFARVFSFARAKMPFYESRSNTAMFFNVTRRAVIKAVTSLMSQGLLVEDEPTEISEQLGTRCLTVPGKYIAMAPPIPTSERNSLPAPKDGEPNSSSIQTTGEQKSLLPDEENAQPVVQEVHPIRKNQNKDFE